MTTSLSRLKGTSIEELGEFPAAMENYIRNMNNQTRQEALEAMEQNVSLVQRLLPSAVERERRKIAIQDMRQLAESRRAMLRLCVSSQIELARMKADELVKIQGMEIVTRISTFANQKPLELEATLVASQNMFLETIEPQFEKLENYRHRPELYEPARQSLQHMIDTYAESNRRLLDGFKEAISNRTSQAQR